MSTRHEKFENYDEFVDKFKPKKTTDDCYTPENIYNAIAEWVASKYNLNSDTFCRPFYPGGDYEHFDYTDKVVVDNPPFSILSEIVKFYVRNNVKFYLFAPTLVYSASICEYCTAIVVGCDITYENGAVVQTSFVTNLEPDSIRMKTEPQLFAIVNKINKINNNKQRVPKYTYPDNIITTSRFYPLNESGCYMEIPRCESVHIRKLDAQQGTNKVIFGTGLLVSDEIAETFAKLKNVPKIPSPSNPTYIWELSDREQEIVNKLNKESAKNGM